MRRRIMFNTCPVKKRFEKLFDLLKEKNDSRSPQSISSQKRDC
jgi:hypothetical protein